MRKYFFVLIAMLFTFSGKAQKTADIGIWGGGSTYWGDMTKVEYGQSINPIFGAYFRYNFNPRVSTRAMYLTGNVGASGSMKGVDWDFNKAVHDVSLLMEINYLKYILGFKRTPFTPYVLAGIGLMYYPYKLTDELRYNNSTESDYSRYTTFNPNYNPDALPDEPVIATTFPFGMGFKYTIGKRLGVGMEVLFRKIFDDKLDNLDDPLSYTANPDIGPVTYTDQWHNNDYVSYVGIHLTYSIYLGKEVCPVYDSKVKN